MKRLIFSTIIKMCGEAGLISIIAGIIIAIIGNVNQWNTSLEYSNAFFIAGCLMIVAGLSTRMAAGQTWGSFQWLHSDSLSDMSPGEKANYIVSASSSFHLVILGALSGILLWFASLLVVKLF